MPKKIKAITSSCVGCGNNMVFNPEINMLFCPSCKSSKKIESNLGLPKHDVNSKNDKTLNKNQDWIKNNHEMECPNCGAQLGDTNKLSCEYCGAKIIRDTQMSWEVTSIEKI